MRKLMMRMGLTLGCVVVGGLWVIHIRAVQRQSIRSGQAYATEAGRDIASTWDPRSLLTRAAPELTSILDPQDLAQNFARLSVFGALTAFGLCAGTESTTVTLTLSEHTQADFRCPVTFEHGTGSVALSLVPAGTAWQIRYFEFVPIVPGP